MRNESNEIPYAGFFVRAAAFIMDMLLVNLLLMPARIVHFFTSFGSPASLMDSPVFFSKTPFALFIWAVTVLYFILLTKLRGATLGKSVFRLKVVSCEERDLTWIEVIFRETAGRFLSSVILMIGYIMIIPDGEKQALHDMLSDTRVIYAHEEDAYRKKKKLPEEPYGVPEFKGTIPAAEEDAVLPDTIREESDEL